MKYFIALCVGMFFVVLACVALGSLVGAVMVIYQAGPAAWIAAPIVFLAVVGGVVAIAGND